MLVASFSFKWRINVNWMIRKSTTEANSPVSFHYYWRRRGQDLKCSRRAPVKSNTAAKIDEKKKRLCLFHVLFWGMIQSPHYSSVFTKSISTAQNPLCLCPTTLTSCLSSSAHYTSLSRTSDVTTNNGVGFLTKAVL